MNYQPGLPERNSNVSPQHPLKEFFVLMAGAAAILFGLLLLLGLLVDWAVESIDPATEVALFAADGQGERLAQSAREQELQQLLDDLGNCADTAYAPVLRIEESEEINALALPGGRIVVYSGLLDAVETENGLAFVLAHELGHFANRDHLRGMGRAVVLLAVSVLSTGANSNLSAFLTPVFSADAAQYSQQRERAADAAALHTLNCHYGHVGGATEFFEHMVALGRERDWAFIHYFSSHPEARERIAALAELARSSGYSSTAP